MTTLLRNVDVAKFAMREFKPDGKDKPTYYVNREEGKRDSVRFQVGDTDMEQEELPFAILPAASYKDSNPDKPSLMLALPNVETQNKIDEIDRKMASLVFDTCRDAIKPNASLEYISDMQTKMLRQPSKEGGKVFVSLKLNRTGKYRTNVAKLVATGDEGNPYAQYPASIEDINSHTIVFALVEISPLWFRGKEWGVSLNATDLLIIHTEDGDLGQKAPGGFVLYNQVVKKISKPLEAAEGEEAGESSQAGGAGEGAGSGAGAAASAETKQAGDEAEEEPPVKKSRS